MKIWKIRTIQKMLALLVIVLINLIDVLVAGVPTAIIPTTTGPVQGEILSTAPNSVSYAAFRGIKYAKAPVGYLRFKPPVSVDPWNETLNATSEGNSCPQFDLITKTTIGSEDCLFLNVFTPLTNPDVTPTTLKSVMVWIHGGGFVGGSGSMKFQRPDYLLEKDIVFVSLNYRLGALGFLSLDHPNATGNAGLKDQNLALKWVKSNIANFGGNPNNVTIFGGSAGSASVGYHVISEASTGLFHGAILMSGVPLATWAYQNPLKAMSMTQTLAKQMGIVTDDKETMLEAFYHVPLAQLVTAVIPSGMLVMFTPTVENASYAMEPFLTESPYWKYYTKNYNKVPKMLGYMEQEMISFTSSSLGFLEVIDYTLVAARKIGVKAPDSFITIRGEIISGGNLSQVHENIVQDAINITSEFHFISSIDRTQRFFAANNNENPTYYYHISFYTNRSLHNLIDSNMIQGAAHGDDLAYIFYIPTANYSTDPNDPVARTISRVTNMWTNFAKYGNPTPNWIDEFSVGIAWPDSGPYGHVLDIGYELTVGSRPINEDTALIELLSWPDEKGALGIMGSIRTIRDDCVTCSSLGSSSLFITLIAFTSIIHFVIQ